MRDPKFPFRVSLRVDGEERQGQWRGNDLVVPVRSGEIYEIRVQNLSGKLVMMRLLVDGLNTLPEKETNATRGIVTQVVAKRVNLNEARAWILDPQRATSNVIRGFVTESGVQGKLRRFQVADAAEAPSDRQKFASDMGIITAAFYEAASDTRSDLFTKLEERETDEVLNVRKGLTPGRLLGVVHLKYVDAGAS